MSNLNLENKQNYFRFCTIMSLIKLVSIDHVSLRTDDQMFSFASND